MNEEKISLMLKSIIAVFMIVRMMFGTLPNEMILNAATRTVAGTNISKLTAKDAVTTKSELLEINDNPNSEYQNITDYLYELMAIKAYDSAKREIPKSNLVVDTSHIDMQQAGIYPVGISVSYNGEKLELTGANIVYLSIYNKKRTTNSKGFVVTADDAYVTIDDYKQMMNTTTVSLGQCEAFVKQMTIKTWNTNNTAPEGEGKLVKCSKFPTEGNIKLGTTSVNIQYSFKDIQGGVSNLTMNFYLHIVSNTTKKLIINNVILMSNGLFKRMM